MMHAAIKPSTLSGKPEQRVMMLVTIEANGVAALRQAVMAACGKWMEFLRVQPVPRTTQVRVWLGLTQSAAMLAMGAIIQALPDGEFGRFIPA